MKKRILKRCRDGHMQHYYFGRKKIYGASPRVRAALIKHEGDEHSYYGQAGRIARLNKDEDISWMTTPDPERRIREAKYIGEDLKKFKDWTKKKKLKLSDPIIEYDGERGHGVRGFHTSPGGPSVDWETSVGDYIKGEEESIENSLKLANEARNKQMQNSAIRLGRSKIFEDDKT